MTTLPASFVLLLSSGVTGPFVHAKAATATVTASTERAVKVRLEGDLYGRQGIAGEVWFPRKAIVEDPGVGYKTTNYRVAKWFRPDDSQWRVIERIADGVISL